MYANLAATTDSVHLADWPVAGPARRIPTLEAEMELARAVTSLGRAARADAKIGVRQPLPRAFVVLPAHVTLRDEVVAEIATELNVKRVETVTSLEGLLDYTVVPNFKALGPRLGKLLPRVRELVVALDGATVRRALDDAGSLTLDVDGQAVTLGPDDLVGRAQQHEDLTLAQDDELAVALDLTLDDALRAEGAAREVVRQVNDRRKAEKLDLADRIRLTLYAKGQLADAVRAHQTWIAGEVLAVELTIAEDTDFEAETFVDGDPLAIRLERA
jgi:isoleucyl-tRNA synthetase